MLLKGDYTVVSEEVSSKFVHDVLPSIEAAQVPGVKSWLAASFKSDGGHHIHVCISSDQFSDDSH